MGDSYLNEEQVGILRRGETEAPGSSKLLHEKRDGSYNCVSCGNEIFSSDVKFDCESGWPSFSEAKRGAVEFRKERDGRTEVLCAKCGGHLGHVFNNGPMPSGKRFCINGAVLNFKRSRKIF